MPDVQPTDPEAFWNGVWQDPANEDYWTRVDPEVAGLIEAASPQDRPDVLDLGCGLGRNALAFAQAGHSVTAADHSGSALASLRSRAVESGLVIRVLKARFADGAFAPGSFDIAIAVNVLYHGLPDEFSRAVAHVRTWLRPHGLFYFTCPTPDDGDFGRGTEVAPNTFEFEPGHVHYNASWADLEPMLAGFRLVSRKRRDHEWENGGTCQFSSRWQVLAEKP